MAALFIVLDHQYGRRDVMWKRSIGVDGLKRMKMKRWSKISQALVSFEHADRVHLGPQRAILSGVFERFGVDSRKRTKTLVWTEIDRCVFDDNENAKF